MTTAQVLGLGTGILFGILLQRGKIVRFETQIGFLLLQNMRILRFMLSAILVGMVGMYLASQAGLITLSFRPMNLGGVLLGGIIFGLGWALTGFCPGTSVGALGEGRLHALPVILGMLAGAMLFAHTYPFLEETILAWKDYGSLSLTDVTGLPPLVIIAACVLGGICLFRFVDKKDL